LSTLRRGRLQRQMALALEGAFPDELEELAPMLGRFFAEAGEAEKGVHYLLTAGERARRLYSFEEAARAYEGALVFLREEDDLELTARTLMKLGLAYQNAFDFERSNKAYDEGLGLWRELSARPGMPPPPATRPLRVVITHEPLTLDPTKAGDVASASLIAQLFSGLAELTQLGELVPAGAVSWDVLEGGRRYVFHLRQDASWSDGQPVTAGDYEYAWKRTLAPGFEGNNYRLLLDIRNARAYHEGELADPGEIGVRALDDWTLQVDLEKPVGYFMQLMAHSSSFPVPRHLVEASGDAWSRPDNLVGNGAFMIESWTPGVDQRYIRNPYYAGPTSGNVQRVHSVVVKAEDLASFYEADLCDILFIGALRPEEQVMLSQRHPGELHSLPGYGVGWMHLNTTRPPLNDVRARQALALALDKNRQVKDLAIQGYEPALGGIVPPAIPGHHPNASLPFEPGRARELLKEIGHYPGKTSLTLRVALPEAALLRQQASVLAKQLDEHLNIRLEFWEIPFSEMFGLDHHDDYHLALYGWRADYPDPDNFLRVAPFDRYSGWQNKEFNDLVERARVVAGQAQRLAMYRRAEEILAREVPTIPVIYPRFEFLAKPWFKNPPISASAELLGKDVILE